MGTAIGAAKARARQNGHPWMVRHGMYGSPEYNAWRSAKQRVTNPNNPRYSSYGGRAIIVAAEWIDDFAAFFAHIGPRPVGTSLDRIDNDGNYEPGNVRWATRSVQQSNQRRQRRST